MLCSTCVGRAPWTQPDQRFLMSSPRRSRRAAAKLVACKPSAVSYRLTTAECRLRDTVNSESALLSRSQDLRLPQVDRHWQHERQCTLQSHNIFCSRCVSTRPLLAARLPHAFQPQPLPNPQRRQRRGGAASRRSKTRQFRSDDCIHQGESKRLQIVRTAH